MNLSAEELEYEKSVLWSREREKYCTLWRLSLERQERDLEEGYKRGLVWDAEAADHAAAFFPAFLKHSKGEFAGQPFELEHSQEFHRIRVLFGWKKPAFDWDQSKEFNWKANPYNPEKWVRRFNRAYIQLPKGTGKSTEAAGIGCYLFHEGEPAAEIYSAGAKKDQAKLVHEEAKRMHLSSPALSRRTKIVRDNISVPSTYSKWECFSRQAKGADGVSPHGGIVDELHQWSRDGKEILDILEHSSKTKRRNPLILVITTAGSTKLCICYERRLIAEKVLRGLFTDDSLFAMVCEPTQEEVERFGWDSVELAEIVNPGFGTTIEKYKLIEDIAAAKADPSARTAYLRYRLNMWVGEQRDKMFNMDFFQTPGSVPYLPGLRGKECILGVDISSSDDIASIAAIFPDYRNDHFTSLEWHYTPENTLNDRMEKVGAPYRRWSEQGDIRSCYGNYVHYREILNKILELRELYDVKAVAFDPWNCGQLLEELANEYDMVVVKVPQTTYGLNDSCKFLKRIILDRRLAHTGNEVTAWMFSNCIAKMDSSGNIKPDKEKSEGKIDGVSAIVTACALVAKNEREEAFVYDKVLPP